MNRLLRRVSCLLLVVIATLLPAASRAGTFVRFDTNVGVFDVELFDTAMSVTVANFLAYVNAGSYTSSLIHRSTTYNPADIQIVQGGGFALTNNAVDSIPTFPSIKLEKDPPKNVRGTIAMARGAAADSATSQFFFNVQSNPALDGNYAVFGNVVGSTGLAALDAIGAVRVYDASPQLGPPFAELPLTAPSLAAGSLVLVNSVGVVPVPEPSAAILAAAGLAASACVRRRAAASPRPRPRG